MVTTPVGMKCPDCGRSKNLTLFQVRPERFLLAGIVSLIAGAATVIIGGLGFFVIFLSVPYGYFAGSMILKASGMKQGLKLEILAGAGMVIGGIFPKVLPAILLGEPALMLASLMQPFFWLALIISTSCAVSKIRYL